MSFPLIVAPFMCVIASLAASGISKFYEPIESLTEMMAPKGLSLDTKVLLDVPHLRFPRNTLLNTGCSYKLLPDSQTRFF